MTIKTSLTVLALCVGLSAPALAIDEHHPEKAVGAKPAEAGAPASKSSADAKALEANAAKLQAQAKRIGKAKPGPERDKLVAEHMHSLREGMEMARGMMSGMKMEGCPMMKGMPGGMGMQAAGEAEGSTSERMDRMEKRMDMMEQMMKGGTPKP